MTITEFCLRIGAAMLAGMIIGLERQLNRKTTGLRTNTLVALGSTLYVLLSLNITPEHGDITRIIGQVVTGIGFLGAGIIFREGANIHGLTTAATVWCSSAIGCMAGAGLFAESAIATVAIVGVNLVLMPIDNRLSRRKNMPE